MSRIVVAGLLLPALCIAGEGAPANDELEAVVVTASPIGDPEFLATVTGSVDRRSLVRSGAANLADALASVPGVTSSGVAPGAGRPVVRGFDANRVRTMEDGIGSFDASDVGADHGVPLDPLAAERVEIVRGPATLRYGSQAIGGVVNALSDRVPQQLVPQPEGEFVAGYGTVADSTDFSGKANLALGRVGVHADALPRRADDYDTPLGTLENSWIHNEGGALGGSWFPGEALPGTPGADRVGLGVVRYASRYGLPGEGAYIDMDQTKLLMRSAFGLGSIGERQLTVDGGWADYEHDEREGDEVHSTFKDRQWELRAEMLLGTLGALDEGAIGVQAQDRDFAALGEGADYLAPTNTRNLALFGFAESRVGERARLQIGARVEGVDVSGTPITDEATKRSFTPFSASLGLVYDGVGPWRVGVALTSAARAPAQTELYARGPHEGSGTFEIGDPSLDIERANSAELSVRWRSGRVHADGAVWIADFDSFIYGGFTGRSCSEEGDCVDGDAGELKELRYGQQGARFSGAEGHAEVELAKSPRGRLELSLLADLVRARFSDGGDVPRIPPWHLGAGLAWEAGRFDASVSVRYAASQERHGEFDTPTPGYTDIGAQFGWRPFRSQPGVEFALVGSNLGDSLQRNAVSINREVAPQPGRNVRLLFSARF
jgi:iron complex outermembrane recepter protein